jgi:hypothetical protein
MDFIDFARSREPVDKVVEKPAAGGSGAENAGFFPIPSVWPPVA